MARPPSERRTWGTPRAPPESRTADRLPLDMYLMLDSSLSMTDFIADGVTTKWQAVQKALTAFVNDANSSGLGVGFSISLSLQPGVPLSCFSNAECKTGGPLQFSQGVHEHPGHRALPDRGRLWRRSVRSHRRVPQQHRHLLCAARPERVCDAQFTDPCSPVGVCLARDICDQGAYASAAVEVAPLPAAAPGIVASLSAHIVDGFTPTGTRPLRSPGARQGARDG